MEVIWSANSILIGNDVDSFLGEDFEGCSESERLAGPVVQTSFDPA